ncbi:chemotaxis protein CheB [Spirillospora sp. NPDC047279]|uniref:chemotaxis protein CheB n=1 Tax=Spirillospora sp. NPDC047279 TaxID=3155478 RepID=UPI00340DBD9C
MVPRRDVVVIGASAGGVEALTGLLATLPADLAAAVLIVTHVPANSPGRLARVLTRSGPLPAVMAADRQRLRAGRILVPRPDHHLLIGSDPDAEKASGMPGLTARVVYGPQENRVRPAVDPLFRSAARWCGPRAVAVVLSGALDDGAAGAAAIAARAGTVLVQDPDEALFAGMPSATLAAVPDAAAHPIAELGAAIADLVGTPAAEPASPTEHDLVVETDMVESGYPNDGRRPGTPIQLGCPDCGGGLNLIGTGGTTHYRCHVGHSFGPRTLATAKAHDAETALWTTISALQEQATIHRQLAETTDDGDARARHQAAAQQADHSASTLREQAQLWPELNPTPGDTPNTGNANP